MTNNEYVVLMMIRCGYVKGYQLTDKGSKLIPRFIWAAWNYLLVTFNNEYEKSVMELLNMLKIRPAND